MPFDPFKQSRLDQGYTKLKQAKDGMPANTDTYDVSDIKRLAGIGTGVYSKDSTKLGKGANMSITATEKAKLMKKHNIQPGTQEWFKLWFSLPYMTGEKPYGPGHNEINQ